MDVETFVRSWIEIAHGGDSLTYSSLAELGIDEGHALSEVLKALDARGFKIRGARGNTPNDILELLMEVAAQRKISKTKLAERASVSRQHLSELTNKDDPSPTLGTILKLAEALEFPLEIESQERGSKEDHQPPKPGQSSSSTDPNADKSVDDGARLQGTGDSKAVDSEGASRAVQAAAGASLSTAVGALAPALVEGEDSDKVVAGAAVVGLLMAAAGAQASDESTRTTVVASGFGLILGAGVALLQRKIAKKR